MKWGNPATFECPKGGENGIHAWPFSKTGPITCARCGLTLNDEYSDDLRESNARSRRELDKMNEGKPT